MAAPIVQGKMSRGRCADSRQRIQVRVPDWCASKTTSEPGRKANLMTIGAVFFFLFLSPGNPHPLPTDPLFQSAPPGSCEQKRMMMSRGENYQAMMLSRKSGRDPGTRRSGFFFARHPVTRPSHGIVYLHQTGTSSRH